MNAPIGQRPDTATALRAQALEALQRGDIGLAERAFERLLGESPGDVEALLFVTARELERGHAARAIDRLQRACATSQDAAILHQLGVAQVASGDLCGAETSLRKALALAPRMFVARLRLGVVFEQQGRRHEAVGTYLAAINTAQAQGRWLSDDTTAPGLRDAVKHAARYVAAERRELFEAIMEPLRHRYGGSEMARVDACLAIYLQELPTPLPDPRQRPSFLYFPGIPSQPFYPRERFPEHARLEAAAGVIREELLAVLADAPLVPFLGAPSAEAVAAGLLGSTGAREAAWDAFFFYRHGERHDANCARSPQTSRLLDTLPLVRIRDHAPETLYSVLRPGTHILPHHGVTNTRLVTHLPLIVPPDCALRVGGQTHTWAEGRCVTFDDTFEHEAWNRSERTRVVLIVDSWNPDLTETERLALTDLVATIGDFNRSVPEA